MVITRIRLEMKLGFHINPLLILSKTTVFLAEIHTLVQESFQQKKDYALLLKQNLLLIAPAISPATYPTKPKGVLCSACKKNRRSVEA